MVHLETFDPFCICTVNSYVTLFLFHSFFPSSSFSLIISKFPTRFPAVRDYALTIIALGIIKARQPFDFVTILSNTVEFVCTYVFTGYVLIQVKIIANIIYNKMFMNKLSSYNESLNLITLYIDDLSLRNVNLKEIKSFQITYHKLLIIRNIKKIENNRTLKRIFVLNLCDF